MAVKPGEPCIPCARRNKNKAKMYEAETRAKAFAELRGLSTVFLCQSEDEDEPFRYYPRAEPEGVIIATLYF